ncbi:MAG: T9SS type A sorting domain-containing protein [Flavobacteriia bacterium]|nr:T9SS type A sorting domain-containing protein [Flavobacteriia bacterium]
MKRIVQLAGFSALLLGALPVGAQVLNPTISGNDMLCPESTGTVATQVFQGYQWYQRYYGSVDTVLIPGATSQSLLMDAYNYSASYLIVEVTDGMVTEMSPDFFVDGWAFLPPTVMTSGDFTIGQNGESIICEGDTLFFELMQPYTTNIVWTNNGSPIPNQTNNVLEVTTSGNYHVSGAPSVCPDYNQNLGVILQVVVQDCSAAGIDENVFSGTLVFPNPASDLLTVQHPSQSISTIAIHDGVGRYIKSVQVNQMTTDIPVDELSEGTYFVTIHSNIGSEVRSVVIQK